MKELLKELLPYFFILVSTGTLIVGGWKIVVYAIDREMDSQDKMLCHSAKISKNEEYTKKCDCFYKGQNIRCIYEGEVNE